MKKTTSRITTALAAKGAQAFQPVCKYRFTGWKACAPLAVALLLAATVTHAATYYVKPDGNDSANGTSWATAKQTIQAAIDTAKNKDEILVTDGVYAPFTSKDVALSIRSVNGAEKTIIDGAGISRCATMARYGPFTGDRDGKGYGIGNLFEYYVYNTALTGFMLRNGSDICGGGALGGRLYDCVLTGNRVCWLPGDPTYLWDLTGGGAFLSSLCNCTVSGNVAYQAHLGEFYYDGAGGVAHCNLYSCVVSGNTSYGSNATSGGAAGCGMVNCLITGNTSYGQGTGGAVGCTLLNCTVTENTSTWGLGQSPDPYFLGTGGVNDSFLYNCIVWDNYAEYNIIDGHDSDNCSGAWLFAYNTCTTPLKGGTLGYGNIDADPLFVNAAGGDFRLRKESSCINTGDTKEFNYHCYIGNGSCGDLLYSMPAHNYHGLWYTLYSVLPNNYDTKAFEKVLKALPEYQACYADLSGAPRFQGSAVDMGAYEYAPPVTCSVTFDSNGGSLANQTITQGLYGCYILPDPAPTRTGYTLAGWFTAKTGGTLVTASTVVTQTKAHTLYAQWTANIYTVTFDAQGGTAVPPQPVTFGSAYGVLPTPTKTDVYFAGWWTGVNGTGTRVRASTTYSTTDDITLYACWTEDLPPYLSDPAGGAAPTASTTYDGFIYDGNGTVHGTMTLSAKVDKKGVWSFSAKAILQAATVSFSGKTNGVADHFQAFTKNNAEKLDVRVEGERFYGEISGVKVGGTFYVDGAKNGFLKKNDPDVDKVQGLYNIVVSDQWLVVSGERPKTQGYLSLSVAAAGAVKYAGQLSDGTKVSGAAKLLKSLNEDDWYAITLYKPLYSKKGFIGGLLWLDASDPNPNNKVIRVDTDYGWFVDWSGGPDGPQALDVLGGYFGDGKNARVVPSGMKFSADVPDGLPLLVAGGAWREELYPMGLEVSPKGTGNSLKLELPKGNPSGATLSYTAKTGIFKGSFKLYCGPDAKGKDKAASVSYSGVMVPDGGGLIGLGMGTTKINGAKVGMGVGMRE